jgi:glutamyl-Q tRNA(Asp) synthetase
MKNAVTRFAPSPTGRLHLGHAYSALIAHRFARDRSGTFLLRIEDIDLGRSRPEHIDGIFEDLEWLGLSFDDEIVYQSDRLPLYGEAMARLSADGLVYPCFCTRAEIAAEIAASAVAPHGPAGAVYPGTCRSLAPDDRKRRLEAEPHAWRLDMKAALDSLGRQSLVWLDHGEEIIARPELFGDVVLARKDAPTSYHLAVTVDDAAQGVTDIVRGRDLFAVTDIHRLLQALLKLPTPAYHHHPLLTDAAGNRLAKRHGAPTIADLRQAGVDPRALADDLLAGRLPAGYSAAAT